MSLEALLKEIYFFKSFTDAELKKIIPIVTRGKFPSGHALFHEGDEALALYLVEIGTVKIFKETEKASVTSIGKGGTFGEMAFLDGGKRSATATTGEETHLIEIPYSKLSSMLVQDSELAVKFFETAAKYMSRRLRATTEDLKKAKELIRHF